MAPEREPLDSRTGEGWHPEPELLDQVITYYHQTLLDAPEAQEDLRQRGIGSPEAVAEAAFQAVSTAARVIDMRRHEGEHARFGATDVCPFVPVAGVDMDECVAIARSVGRRIGEELGIPVYLYEHAASTPARRNLADVRGGEYEGLAEKLAKAEWKPDFGPAAFNAKSGATAVGAREFLIAYNINLNTSDRRYANEIAYELRERGRWKRSGNTDPFYYKGEVVYFEEGKYPDGNSDFVGESFEQLAEHYREIRGGDLRQRYRSIGLDPDDLIGRPVYMDLRVKVMANWRRRPGRLKLLGYPVPSRKV